MNRRALIIRPDYDPPAGAHNAAELMGQVLRSRGFELARCVGPAATREGILAAYDEQIAHATLDDVIVIYYVGHGGLATNSRYAPDSRLPRYVQHICPYDFGDTSDDDFRGICSLELSLKLAQLTARTANVTVVLDCCYAAQMSRAEALSIGDRVDAPVVRPTLTRVGLTRHLEHVRDQARALGIVPGADNLRAVRVVAAGQTELARASPLPSEISLRAFGLTSTRHDEWVSAFTLALAQLLAEIGDASVPWRSIAPALRARLVVQRPEIEGAIARVPFSLTTIDDGMLAVQLDSDGSGASVDGGRLLGVELGDVYDVVPASEPAAVVATVTIDEVSTLQARAAQIEWRDSSRALPPHAVAVATKLALDKTPVRIVAADKERAEVLNFMRSSPRLRPATDLDGAEVVGELRISGGQLELRDALGPLFPPAKFPAQLPEAIADLGNLATERRLRGLAEAGGIAASAVTLELGRLGRADKFMPIARHATPMGLDDTLLLRLENTTDKLLYANVFNVGLRRSISLLSEATSGAELPPGMRVYIGDTSEGPLRGLPLSWPDGLARDQPRPDTVMALITTEPVDVRELESGSYLAQAKSPHSPLQKLFAEFARGVPRGGGAPTPYAILWRDYALVPIEASLDIGVPEVDASPAWDAGSPPGAEASLRLRLESIKYNAHGLRLDVLVCARSATAPVRATTSWSGDAVDCEMWVGRTCGTVDIYVFTSSAGPDRRSLTELLDAEPLHDARAILGMPKSRLAGGASLQIAAAARRALQRLSPAVATVLRGSFGAGDVGVIRCQAQTVTFTVAVEVAV